MSDINIEELIDAIAAKNYNQAKNHFESILGDKMHDALEQEKISVADKIFNGVEEDEEQLEFDLEDEEDDN
jgi:hypothetical protein